MDFGKGPTVGIGVGTSVGLATGLGVGEGVGVETLRGTGTRVGVTRGPGVIEAARIGAMVRVEADVSTLVGCDGAAVAVPFSIGVAVAVETAGCPEGGRAVPTRVDRWSGPTVFGLDVAVAEM